MTISTVRTLARDLWIQRGEDVETALRRIDRAESDAVRQHLLGDLSADPGPVRLRPRR